jgi:hypothetical protein
MGKIITHVSFDAVHKHSPVDIYWWCTEQYGEMGKVWWRSNVRKEYDFYQARDATMFLLRWS